jgi:hypothetical protein
MKLSLDETFRCADRGPLEALPAGMVGTKRGGVYVCRMDASEGKRWRFDQALLIHCYNHFQELVKNLEHNCKYRAHADECKCRSETSGPVEDERRCDCWVAKELALLKKVNEVEVP